MPASTLKEALLDYGRDAYLLTVSPTGPHTSNVTVNLDGDRISCVLSAGAAQNITAQPNVSLFWPPLEPGGYAIILNGVASGEQQAAGGTATEIRLTKSVFHRPGPKPANSDGPCASDCKPIGSMPRNSDRVASESGHPDRVAIG